MTEHTKPEDEANAGALAQAPTAAGMPDTGPLADIAARVQRAHAGLSPQLRQAARYILAHPEDVALTSMRRLADHAGVKPSTMVRLARALDFDGYEALREPYRAWLRGGEGAYLARARTLQARQAGAVGDAAHAALLEDMLSADVAAQREGLHPANARALYRACDRIRAARTVYVLGLRSCHALAHLFHYAYSLVYDNSVLVDAADGTLFDRLARIGPEDVVLSISFRPYTEGTVQATAFAVAKGARVVALTDSLVSPLAAEATQTIVIDTASPSYFQSLVPALAQVQALLALIVAAGGEDALNAIDRMERDLDAIGAYWTEPKRRRRTP
ncbi:MurR/RpiR family transcriptional regulator [Roseospira marina]|uniref:MurR/RpiR family transcriptional regulator n=1 Tax=Roseospira marina TaxID=140057 RepID=A0A5M6IB28_9PROT|nr:MurR/RpiR family transcriptional regulator [Roseospira marina]KAA5605167.1 MurR/RpiR family transcriptional regulator [Roseospira marina]MBB4314924.1 DNA-binding MurR/RpiR family transcriptional regulator [Roseospira marina]MBB5087924.1 DNA-binding MurR/RpiR family transcriptional regulator [Roseospira marina]